MNSAFHKNIAIIYEIFYNEPLFTYALLNLLEDWYQASAEYFGAICQGILLV